MVPGGSPGSGRGAASVCSPSFANGRGWIPWAVYESRGEVRFVDVGVDVRRHPSDRPRLCAKTKAAFALLSEKFEPSDEIESKTVSSSVDEVRVFSRETTFFDRVSHLSRFFGPFPVPDEQERESPEAENHQ